MEYNASQDQFKIHDIVHILEITQLPICLPYYYKMNSLFISKQSPSTDTHVKSQASFLSLYKGISQKN